ncbi:MAG: M20/M25/M40 family metallo-hydrolase [Candidatus Limiplasma sp.]|nr:M20/M25/M40 family metallo-hydrolase [Candidatus Limiplasma sp.]
MPNNRLFELFSELVSLYSPSFGERELCDTMKAKLFALGIAFEEDNAGAILGGNCGNLYGYLEGAFPSEPLLLSAHLDTVEPAKGKKAILHADGTITSDGTTILGADNVSGIAVILEAIKRMQETNAPHRPIELLFPVAEEKYGAGSAVFDYSKIRSKQALVLDLGGEIGNAANAAPTIFSFTVTVNGKAAHAGFAPKDGVHAIAAAAGAIAKLTLGEPEPGVTCNIGLISGGEAGNIVPAKCTVTGEIRSLDHDAVLKRWEGVKSAFHQAAADFGATVEFENRVEIAAYHISAESAVARRFKRACEAIGATADIHSTLGGSDNNNFARHGIEGLVIACSMHQVHGLEEYAVLSELEQCVELVVKLLTEA